MRGADHLRLLLAFGLAAAIAQPRLPDPAPDGPPSDSPAPDGFNTAAALQRLDAWAAAPRPSGSPAHASVRAQLTTALESSGFVVQALPFPIGDAAGVNLLAHSPDVLPDATPDKNPSGVWLTAHTDTVPGSPGAADDGLGLTVAVGVAEALSSGTGPPPGLHILLTDGEESGLRGARAFTRSPYWPDKGAPLVINVEARGTSGPAYMFQTAGPDPRILSGWQRSGCDAQTGSFARAVYQLLPNDTDFTVFRRQGAWGYDLALIHGAHRYHTADDTPDRLDPRSLQQTGDCALALARHWLDRLGRRPPANPASPAAEGSQVYGQILGYTWIAPAWRVRMAGVLVLLSLPWRDLYDRRRALLPGLIGWALAPALSFGLGWLGLSALLRWPGFLQNPAEIDAPWPIYLAAAAAGLLPGPLLLRPWIARYPDLPRGWHLGAALLAAAAALADPSLGYLLLPGAAVSALRLRDQPRLALIPAALAGLWLGPLLTSLPVALTTRALPLLCVAPWVFLAWLL